MFKYNVSKDDFTEMTVYIMKQKSARLISKVKLVLFTVVQMGIIAWLIIRGSNVSPILRILMGVFSVVWAVQTVLSYGCFGMRAKMMLTRQKDQDPNGDFWKEHRMQLTDSKVEISYGATKASLECTQITGTEETENLTLLMSGKNIFEIVPKKVSEKESFKAFLEEINATAARRLKEAQDKQRSDVLENAVFREYLQIPEEEIVERQVKMKRLSLLTPAGWTNTSFLIFGIPLVLFILACFFGSPLYIGLAALFFLLTNAGTLMIFTPLYKNVVRKRLQPAGEEGYLLAVGDGKIHWFTREYHFRYPVSDIRRVIDREEASYYYFPNLEMLFVPASVRDEFKKALVKKRRSLSEIIQSQTPEEEEETEE